MFPGRHWLGLGSGEALNEHAFAERWPEAPERIARMFEAIEVIQRLFSGRPVRHEGRFFRHETVRLWTHAGRPAADLRGHGRPGHRAADRASAATGSSPSAPPLEKIATVLGAFAEGATRGRQGPGDDAEDPPAPPLVGADRRGGDGQRAARVAERRDEVPQAGHPLAVRLRADRRARPAGGLRRADADQQPTPSVHRAEIQRFVDMGFDRVYLHNVGRNQREWIEVFGRDVLPGLVA